RELINTGPSQRAAAKIKVRQPLRLFEVRGKNVTLEDLYEYKDVFEEELNVKDVVFNADHFYEDDPDGQYIGQIDTELNDVLLREGAAREVVRSVQNARKDAGLNVDDRIVLSLSTSDDELNRAISEHAAMITAETLTADMTTKDHAYKTSVTVDGATLDISLEKV
ncbi:MAG TPA: DUF5915 domain-containing protein, partial [Candidatus Saccharibacteria bacterium]|nr:DUF5915 domain-containing protein [Candidatus Saccharibacteria bacterium]